MLHSESFTVKGDVPLFVDCWQAAGAHTTNKILLVLHGLGEHGGRYRHLAGALGSTFDRVYAMDQRGHGRSGGLRGFAESIAVLRDDLKRVAAEVCVRERCDQGKKLFLLAHSFGGMVAVSLLLRERGVPFEGAIISAPLLSVALRVPAYKKALGELLGRTLSKIQLTNEVNPSHLTHDPAVVEAYVNDRLVHEKITPKLYLCMTAEMEWIMEQSGPLACPSLFLVPGDDRIVSSRHTLAFFRGLKSPRNELREYPGMFHEVVNETDKQKVFADIQAWVGTAGKLKQVKTV